MKIGDLSVNRLGYGAMRVCGPSVWGPPKDRAHALRVLRRAYELGCNFFDTADAYGPHVDEELIAEALHPYPKDLVIATKGGLTRPAPQRWDEDGRPEHLRRALEASLKRLKLERIDVYQLHAPDPKVPFEESVGALAEFQRQGKVRHVGVSNVTLKQLEQARKIVTVVSVQNEYNLEDLSSENVLKACERLAILFLAFAFDYVPHRPHAITAAEDRYRATSVVESALLNVLLLGQNYHLVHHLYPGVPFYRYQSIWTRRRATLLQYRERQRAERSSRTAP